MPWEVLLRTKYPKPTHLKSGRVFNKTEPVILEGHEMTHDIQTDGWLDAEYVGAGFTPAQDVEPEKEPEMEQVEPSKKPVKGNKKAGG